MVINLPDNQRYYTSLLLSAVVIFSAWLIMSFSGVASAVEIWYGNEIFNHGFLIIPGTLYFAYIKRGEWLSQPIKSTFLPLPFLVLGIVLYVVGLAGDIQLFMHTAAFGLLPVLVWLLLGFNATYQLLFPMVFLFFAIPVGEQLVPWLQEITADFSVYMLELSGIPLFRSGLYIEIPNGRFLVAEACSGISFFIASIVVGSVYAYLNFHSTAKRVGFFVLSVVYPIIANAIRVYGIILVGYLSDMEHAVGADHLIYGWFFFAIVLISLLAIGEWIRDEDVQWTVPLNPQATPNIQVSSAVVGTIVICFGLGLGWMKWIDNTQAQVGAQPAEFVAMPASFSTLSIIDEKLGYRPQLKQPTELIGAKSASADAYIYQAWFNGQSAELVSGLHRLYSEKEWSLVSTERFDTQHINNISLRQVSSPTGNLRFIASWYVIAGQAYTDDTNTKLYQTSQVLLGHGKAGLRVIVSVPVSADAETTDDAKQHLRGLIDELVTGS